MSIRLNFAISIISSLLILACGPDSGSVPDLEATVEARLDEERRLESEIEDRAQAMANEILEIICDS